MKRTLSEYLFERFCDDRGMPWTRIPEVKTRTPDYELFRGAEPLVVEVKEIERNAEELENDRLVEERGWGDAIGHTPGDRLRLKIAACSKQIKARTQGRFPSLLVVFDERGEVPHLESYSIRVAMYGLEQVHIAVPLPGMGSPYRTGMGYGPKRKMTPDHNTSISAVAAMVMTRTDRTEILVYHNRYAKIPLRPRLLAPYGIKQFALEDDVLGAVAGWQPAVSDVPTHGSTSPE